MRIHSTIPTIFVGHGNPMSAERIHRPLGGSGDGHSQAEGDPQRFRALVRVPEAAITAIGRPRTIHDLALP